MFKIQKLEKQTLSSNYWSAQNENMLAFSPFSLYYDVGVLNCHRLLNTFKMW